MNSIELGFVETFVIIGSAKTGALLPSHEGKAHSVIMIRTIPRKNPQETRSSARTAAHR